MSVSSILLKDNIRPHETEEVKIIDCGNVIELQSSQHHSAGAQIRKLNRDEYVDIRTGEVKEFEHNTRRTDDTKSLRRSFEEARRIINANVTEPDRCRFITLTYAENMRDRKKLYNDFGNFWKRKISPAYPGTEYIIATEPQGRGAWHIHLLLLFPDTAPFIPNEQLAGMWGHGFVSVRALDNVDNVGAYLTAYLSNIPLDECENAQDIPLSCIADVDYLDDSGKPVSKKVVKSARLHLYPNGMHVFRYSKGIKKPKPYYTTAECAEQLVNGCMLCNESTRLITDMESGYTNISNYRQYNRIRTKTP
ncbi:MAG: hypothetical protein ACI3XP_00975 [Eubacteriales bacterium]